MPVRSDVDLQFNPPHPRSGGTRRYRVLLALILSVLIAGVGSILGWRLRGGGHSVAGCHGQPETILVAASPGEATVLSTLATQWTAGKPTYQGRCIGAKVVAKDSSQVANALGNGWDLVRDGSTPDVWVPDSRLWFAVAAARPDAAAMLPSEPTSVASSPVVLAVRKAAVQALGWPQRPLGWQEVLAAFAQPGTWAGAGHPELASLRVGLTDPARSTPGLASVLTLLDQNGTGTVSDAQFVQSVGITQSVGAFAPDTTTFFNAQTEAAGQGANSVVGAFPALERDVAAYNAENPAEPLVPIYLPRSPVVADFPYAMLGADWVNSLHRTIAGQFLRYLLSPAGQNILAEQRLRGPDYSVRNAAALPAEQGFQQTIAVPRKTPDPVTLNRVISTWTDLERPVNVLVVLDTSGSMNEPVPGTPMTRLQLMQQTAITGFGLMTNQTSMGLWEFSTRMGQNTEYRELVPYGSLAQPVGSVPRRSALFNATRQLTADGSTPLYDTVYAAFRNLQEHWQPNSTNAIMLVSDGANQYPGGMDLGQLLDRLTHEKRADQPVSIVGVAVGPDADAAAMQQISQATGGRTFVARDPAAAMQTLVLAFAGRLK
jgi:Ca-activated chloride channel homolog